MRPAKIDFLRLMIWGSALWLLLEGVVGMASAQVSNGSNVSYNGTADFPGLFETLQGSIGGGSMVLTGLIILAMVSVLIFISGQGLELVLGFGIPFTFTMAVYGLLPDFIALLTGATGITLFGWGILNTWAASR